MNKKDFREKLLQLKSNISELEVDDGVYNHSALYAFLKSANYSVTYALFHFDEYNTYIDE